MADIVYISFTTSKHLGVRKKNLAQIAAWENSGYIVEVVFDSECGGLFSKFFNRYSTIFSYFIFNRAPGARLYLRQTLCLPFMGYFSKFRSFCYEVNADYNTERSNYSGLRRLIHLVTKDNFLKHAHKVFFVSAELAHRFSPFVRGEKYVFPNSIVKIPVTKKLPRGNNVVFVGTDVHEWQGVDYLYSLVELMPEYQFHLIGDFSCNPEAYGNLHNHGVLSGSEYNNVMMQMDYAIGTLAFYRSGLTEGSPLKVRDYASYDLPVAAAYQDSDFDGCVFFLKISVTDLRETALCIDKFFSSWRYKSYSSQIATSCFFYERELLRLKNIMA